MASGIFPDYSSVFLCFVFNILKFLWVANVPSLCFTRFRLCSSSLEVGDGGSVERDILGLYPAIKVLHN